MGGAARPPDHDQARRRRRRRRQRAAAAGAQGLPRRPREADPHARSARPPAPATTRATSTRLGEPRRRAHAEALVRGLRVLGATRRPGHPRRPRRQGLRRGLAVASTTSRRTGDWHPHAGGRRGRRASTGTTAASRTDHVGIVSRDRGRHASTTSPATPHNPAAAARRRLREVASRSATSSGTGTDGRDLTRLTLAGRARRGAAGRARPRSRPRLAGAEATTTALREHALLDDTGAPDRRRRRVVRSRCASPTYVFRIERASLDIEAAQSFYVHLPTLRCRARRRRRRRTRYALDPARRRRRHLLRPDRGRGHLARHAPGRSTPDAPAARGRPRPR